MSKIFINHFGKRIEEAVNDKHRMSTLIKYIERYFDKNSEVLFAQGPAKALLFTNTDKEIIYDTLQITPAEVAVVMKQLTNIKANWQLLNDPFIILSVFLIRQLELSKKTRERDLVIMYLTVKTYSGLQRRYIKFGANEQIMAYTLNNISDKFKYKALKNNYNVIKDISMRSHEFYTKLLVKGEDEMLNTYYPQIYNRINKVIKKIAQGYYANRDSKKYLNTLTTYDDAKGGNLDYDNTSGIIEQLAENTTNFFMSSTVSMRLARTVAERNSIPYVSVYQTLIEMRKSEDPKALLGLMRSIVEVIYESDNSVLARVCSRDFAILAIKQLSVSNSSSKALEHVKAELDRILETHCSKYALTQRLATKMSYRNAIYTYLVYILIANKCG